MSISVVINTINEEANIERAIRSVKKFADSIVVVDMESSDNTVQLARKHGAQVFSHKKTHYVEPARNFAIQKAKGEWILILDADEEAPLALLSELKRIAEGDLADFVRIPRKNMIFGKWMTHARWWPDYNIRFFKKGSVTWEDEIHSIPITQGREFNVTDYEELAIIHHHYDSVEQYLDRMNRYTSIQAQELMVKGHEVNVSDFIRKPTGEFLSRYFAGEGYKDGLHGLVISSLQGLSELAVYSKLWQLGGFKERHTPLTEVVSEITEAQKDTNYWKAHAQIKEGSGFKTRIKRKFKLQ